MVKQTTFRMTKYPAPKNTNPAPFLSPLDRKFRSIKKTTRDVPAFFFVCVFSGLFDRPHSTGATSRDSVLMYLLPKEINKETKRRAVRPEKGLQEDEEGSRVPTITAELIHMMYIIYVSGRSTC